MQEHQVHRHQPKSALADAHSYNDPPESLSAAIEVKFLLPVYGHTGEDDGQDDDHAGLVVPERPQDIEGLHRQAYESLASTIAAVKQRSITLHDIASSESRESDYWDTHWIIKKANSALPSRAEEAEGPRCHWVPVEICSPKQPLDELNSKASLRAIAAVLTALRDRHRVVVNYTCDVHVHVGRRDGRPLSLTTLKRLATMLWLSEDMIRRVRDPASPNFHNVFTWGAEVKQHSRLAHMVANEQYECHATVAGAKSSMPRSLRRAVRAMWSGPEEARKCAYALGVIWQASSYAALGKLLSGPTRQFRRLGFNFSSLGEEDERARTGPRTVEFRVLEGTVDGDLVCAWVMLCWKLVAVAGDHDVKSRDGGRFVRAVKYCLVNNQDGRGMRRREDLDVLKGSLQGLIVGCLGLDGPMYDVFVEAVMRGRTKHNWGDVTS
jgi:hypothetical protein